MDKKMIKVLIVDDSVVFREALARGISKDEGITVVGRAFDPIDAMKKIEELNPDVLTLDIEMPRMNGIEFLNQLMPKRPLPVVVVSSAPISIFDALDAGAVDFVRKPKVSTVADMDLFCEDMAAKIRIASNARVAKKSAALPSIASIANNIVGTSNKSVIAIGASTGGTEAILSVVENLPSTTPGIVIVQHMPPVFTKMYAERINKICKMDVDEAKNGDRVVQGKILIAPGGEQQMTLMKDATGYFVKLTKGEKVSGHCPSVDVLFNSVAKTAGNNAVGVILTGMGSDGAKGLLEMRRTGAHTIGQDKESCVVYGMPMVAQNIGAVEKQCGLTQIPMQISNFLSRR
ncbi:MAG: chemotaxis response regulator protein-glutamate methylesterase [Oscillospiraceae bacterium]